MKRSAQALLLGVMLLTAPVFAQDKPKADTTPAPTAQVTTQTQAPAPQVTAPAPQQPAPAKDPKDWKRPLKDIKFREF